MTQGAHYYARIEPDFTITVHRRERDEDVVIRRTMLGFDAKKHEPQADRWLKSNGWTRIGPWSERIEGLTVSAVKHAGV